MPHRVQHNYYHALRLKELRRLYWAHTVKELASSLVTIFVPIYLYRLHYSIPAILTYFLLASAFWGLIQLPILYFANRIGFNRSMGLSLIIQGLQILMLATIARFHWPLWSISFAWSLSISLYWPEFRSCFTRSLLHRRIAPAVGVSSALLMLALGIAPAIGGAIASLFGIATLYVLTMLCFVAAALPLFVGSELMGKASLNLRGIRLKKIWRDLVANLGAEVDDSISSSVWPLFIFLIVHTYVGVGILSSVAVTASIIIAFYTGRRRTKERSGYLKHGTNVISLTNAFRLFTSSAGQIAGVNFFNGLGQALMVTPYYSRYYQNAENEPVVPYVYAMMMACAVGDVLVFGFLILLSTVLPIKEVLAVGLGIGVPAGYCIRLIRAPKTG